ncbi:hypothetical protein Back11_19440 [Paenibacillus baekrokdamisoli]|uniref:Uncharacterized protein n=1 Tax=Paenibacillus baekrokdamisoli TaxID=1712516 RepID=A0A3G9JCC1_9BACL|nr:hypothetical protein [Paenibacillus baekrokdamisoli]MBB3070053.1 hypothetical protein [Paenibacillus baekrokdamisoli]BBH20599.1 hypothetical protein Back11_19440 [Paenibacillus baekrokdamisoli]
MSHADYYNQMPHDKNDPNPFLAIYLDQSIPFNEEAKAAYLKDCSSKSRQFLLPVLRPIARMFIILLQVFKIVVPKRLTSSRLLHRILYWGMRTFVSPDANYMILRHFFLGSEVLQFIRDNVPGVHVEMNPLKPTNLEPVKDDLFLIHDLNLYNFVINLNREIRAKNIEVSKQFPLNFGAITSTPIPIEQMPNRWTNFVDLTTAIECFTPVYQLFLTDNDFWRATNSLQLDETIGILASKIIGNNDRLALINNKHPMVPLTTLRAGFRLVLHGLATEQMHALLVELKQKQAS